jgi:hypothetical protein
MPTPLEVDEKLSSVGKSDKSISSTEPLAH